MMGLPIAHWVHHERPQHISIPISPMYVFLAVWHPQEHIACLDLALEFYLVVVYETVEV